MPTSTTPAVTSDSSTKCRIGLLATGTSCLALVWVIGRSRVPRPPASTSAFIDRASGSWISSGERLGQQSPRLGERLAHLARVLAAGQSQVRLAAARAARDLRHRPHQLVGPQALLENQIIGNGGQEHELAVALERQDRGSSLELATPPV